MSHTTIYFLAEAENLEQAENRAVSYLEPEHFFDCFTVIKDESGSLTEKREELTKLVKDWNWEKKAEDFLLAAQRYRAAGELEQYGYLLIDAGQLYAQCLTIDTYVFNVDAGDYSIPPDDTHWWVIAVDFHY